VITSVTTSAFLNSSDRLEPFVELKFPVLGKYLPADHNYGLFAAFVHLIPELRQETTVSILTIPGIGDKDGKILLTQESCLRIRVPISRIPLVYPLAGKRVSVGKHEIQIGIPQVTTLRSATRMRARIVTIKNHQEPDSFLEAVKRQLNDLEISGVVTIPADRDGKLLRKTIKIQKFTVVGFTVQVSELREEDSVKLQEFGVGGKRHMGCGFFLPCNQF
jgi:CRISPR-associated protein Cas6